MANSGNEWVQVLKNLAEERWSNGQRALLLAQVPALLKEKGVDLSQALKGRKLRDAIAYEGSGLIWLVQNPQDSLVWGVVHDGTIADSDPEALFLKRRQDAVSRPQFYKAFWFAFIMSLKKDYERYVAAKAPFRFTDMSMGDLLDFDGIKIAPEYIIKSDAVKGDFDAEVYSSIQNWGADNKIKLSQFYWRGPADFRTPSLYQNREKWLTEISKLATDDLARISVPLDIVAKLLGRKGSTGK